MVIIVFNSDILKHTPADNPDYGYLNQAVSAIKKVLTWVCLFFVFIL